MEGDGEMALPEEVVMSKIRWGVMLASPDMLEGLHMDEVVLHLTLGTKNTTSSLRVKGRLYV